MKPLVFRVRMDDAPSAVTVDGAPAPATADEASLATSNANGYWYDPQKKTLVVRVPARGPTPVTVRATKP